MTETPDGSTRTLTSALSAPPEAQPSEQPEPSRAFEATELLWHVDPVQVALGEAARERNDVGAPVSVDVCTEVGRRLLLAQFTFSSWVLRRVEKVQFVSDRRISRTSSIELRVPENAPVIVDPENDKQRFYLVPLSVMRRRTLVNLDIRDEHDEAISLMGLRFTQKLDASMLRAAALMAATPDPTRREQLDSFIDDVVSGEWADVKKRFREFESWRSTPLHSRPRSNALHVWFDHDLFSAALERTWHNFTLFVALPVDRGQHRILRLSFEESVLWRYQRPKLEKPGERVEYKPLKKFSRWLPKPFPRIGWRSTRIRFLTPSAEHCASYHFEFTAPRGLWISSAELLAGRPNSKRPGESVADRVRSTGSSVGLHVVEVPASSLCRAQVDLSIPSRGWLSSMLASSIAVAIVMISVTWHAGLWGVSGHWEDTQVTNIVLLLITVCGGVTTYVAQHPAGDVAARMVSRLRFFGVLALSLPAVAAMFVVYLSKTPPEGMSSGRTDPMQHLELVSDFGSVWRRFPATTTQDELIGRFLTLTSVSLVIAAIMLIAWLRAIWIESSLGNRPSPWEMTEVDDDRRDPKLVAETMSFRRLAWKLRFRSRAIGVNSAEGWHEVYTWSNQKRTDAVNILQGKDVRSANLTGCRCAECQERAGSVAKVKQRRPGVDS